MICLIIIQCNTDCYLVTGCCMCVFLKNYIRIRLCREYVVLLFFPGVNKHRQGCNKPLAAQNFQTVWKLSRKFAMKKLHTPVFTDMIACRPGGNVLG